MPQPRHVVLTGLMSSGKTTVGHALARRLGRRYLDNDSELARRTGDTARDIAAREGLDTLHRDEAAAFMAALATTEPAVVGAPASVITDPDMRRRLRDHYVVWLDTDIETLAGRLHGKGHRPVIQGDVREFLERQHRERAPFFREAASQVVHPRGDDADEVAQTIADAFMRDEPSRGEAHQ
jgi:shikimate kinase